MAGLYASWIHGNSCVAEFDNSPGAEQTSLHSLVHFGWGSVAKIKPSASVWFHVPIPTPVIVSDQRLQLVKFFLLFKLVGHGTIQQVDLWDGSVKVAERYANHRQGPHETLGLSGDHLKIDRGSTFQLLKPLKSWSGFCISFKVHADEYADGAFIPFDHPLELTVSAAGGDFVPAQ